MHYMADGSGIRHCLRYIIALVLVLLIQKVSLAAGRFLHQVKALQFLKVRCNTKADELQQTYPGTAPTLTLLMEVSRLI